MLRSVACAIAALVLPVTIALGGEISDANNTFRLTVPDDWTRETLAIPELALIVVSPRWKETGGNCNVVVQEVEETRSMTQAELEAELSTQIDEETWKAQFRAVKEVKSTTIEKSGDRVQRGRKVFYAKATSEFEMSGVTFSLTQLIDLHAVPGRTYATSCTAFAAAFEQEEREFEMIMTSFEPIVDMTVAAAARPVPATVGDPGRRQAIREAIQATAHALMSGALRARAP